MALLTRILILVIVCELSGGTMLFAQSSVNIRATDSSLGTSTQVGDATNHALRVNLVASSGPIRIGDVNGVGITSRAAGGSRPLEIVQLDASGNIVTPSAGTGTSSNFTSGFPASGTAVGYSDGTNMQAARVFDLDSGGGTQYGLGVNLRRSSSGGSAELLGAATSANSLPVVLASDQAAIAVTQSGAWSTRTQDGSGNLITSRAAGSSRPMEIVQLDASGAIVTPSAGTGTSSNFGSAFPASGTAAGGYDGTNMQGLRVVDADTSGGTFYALTTNAVFRTSGTPVEAGTVSNPWNTTGLITSIIPGTGATNQGKAIQSTAGATDTGVAFLGVRKDAAADLSGGAGKYTVAEFDANGSLWVNPFPASPAAATYLPVRLTDGSGFVAADTQLTHDSALTPASTTGGAFMVRASAAAPANVGADDRAVLPWALRSGAIVVALSASNGTLLTANGTSLNTVCVSGCSGGVQYAEDAASIGGETLTLVGAIRQDTLSSTTSTDGDYANLKVNGFGSLYTHVMGFGTAAAQVGNGTNGSSLRVAVANDNNAIANWGHAAIGAAPPTGSTYVSGVTSGATGGLLTGIPICDSQGWLDMTSATTTEIAPLVSSRTIHVCQITAVAGGTTTMTLKRGTGSNCGTGTTAVSPGWELTAQVGFAEGNGVGEVLGAAGAGTAGGAMTAGNALCVTNSAAVNLHVKVRYAVY